MCQDLVGHTFFFSIRCPSRSARATAVSISLSLVRPLLLLCSPIGDAVEDRQSPPSISLSLLLFVWSLKQGRCPLVSVDQGRSAAVTRRPHQRFQLTSLSRPSIAHSRPAKQGENCSGLFLLIQVEFVYFREIRG
ncbi:unnamed protein product [Cuscuta campestris]|uniref:Uncharacterized protein n=1 Tax=Cuscuta campestris TaxID=132261 RepID=A0A484KWZ9_9ASTE|nr:unnamed protein product [Cuscuta campestris]